MAAAAPTNLCQFISGWHPVSPWPRSSISQPSAHKVDKHLGSANPSNPLSMASTGGRHSRQPLFIVLSLLISPPTSPHMGHAVTFSLLWTFPNWWKTSIELIEMSNMAVDFQESPSVNSSVLCPCWLIFSRSPTNSSDLFPFHTF